MKVSTRQPQLFRCVVDGELYDPFKTRAERRGFCSMACQHELERRVGFDHQARSWDSEGWKRFQDKCRALRSTVPDAEPLDS